MPRRKKESPLVVFQNKILLALHDTFLLTHTLLGPAEFNVLLIHSSWNLQAKHSTTERVTSRTSVQPSKWRETLTFPPYCWE